jgi:MIP family channel proteins
MAEYMWKALFAEFLGTFTLVFVGASAVALTAAQGGTVLASALAFGLALAAVIYVWGSFSGAHVNPAVSLGFAASGQMSWLLMIGYWIAQLLGGIAAAALVVYFFGTSTGAGASIGSFTNSNLWKAVLMEAFLTMFLVIAYLLVYRNPMNAMIGGLIIGLVLSFCTIVGSSSTGASTNPARSLGPAIFSMNMGTYWVYIVGPLLGALVAALVYKLFVHEYNCSNKAGVCGEGLKNECGKPIKECSKPMVDSCGKPVVDGDGNCKMMTYTKVATNPGYMQENNLSTVGRMLQSVGVEPSYVAQEVIQTVEAIKTANAGDQTITVIRQPLNSLMPSNSPSGTPRMVVPTPKQ